MIKSKEAIDALKAKGLDLFDKPKGEIPRLPRDITELHDDDLMDLFVQFTAWTDHLSSQLAIAAIDERESDRSVSVAESQAMLSNWKGGSGDRITVVKAQIATDPTVIGFIKELDEKHAYRKLLETLYQNVERDSSVVSRELTRRTSDSGSRKRKYTV